MENLKKALISMLACFMIVNCNQSYAGTRIVVNESGTHTDGVECIVLDEETQTLVKADDKISYL